MVSSMCDCSEEKRDIDQEESNIFENCTEKTNEEINSQKEIFHCKDKYATRVLRSEPALLYKYENDPQLSPTSSGSSTEACKCVNSSELQLMRLREGEESAIFSETCEAEEKINVEEIPDVECTLAIIKPEAMNCRKEIERRIYEEGFEVYQTRWLRLTPEQASEFYSDSYGQINFAHLVAYMSSGPIVAMVLAKHQAVQEWRMLIGPKKVTESRLYYPESIRAQFGCYDEEFKNAVHGSRSREEAEKEIHFFFPDFIIEPILKKEMAVDYLWEVINSVLVEGLTECCKEKPADPILWFANWLLTKNPYKPKMSEELMLIPT